MLWPVKQLAAVSAVEFFLKNLLQSQQQLWLQSLVDTYIIPNRHTSIILSSFPSFISSTTEQNVFSSKFQLFPHEIKNNGSTTSKQ